MSKSPKYLGLHNTRESPAATYKPEISGILAYQQSYLTIINQMNCFLRPPNGIPYTLL